MVDVDHIAFKQLLYVTGSTVAEVATEATLTIEAIVAKKTFFTYKSIINRFPIFTS